jgi:alkylation response protein AidB-like acyl-CoA dehydrogenase
VFVDLDLTPNQELFVQTSARFIESTCPRTRVRELAAAAGDPGPEYRRQAAELGWFAMLVPEDQGGGSVSDNGVYDAALIAYQRGGALQPGGFVGTNVVAYALAMAGSEDQQAKVLEPLLAGDTSAAWAMTGSRSDGSPTAGVRAERRTGSYVLSGTKTVVQDADRSDWLLVTGAGDDGPVQALVAPDASGVSIRALEGLDITRRFCEVELDGVEVPTTALVGTPETAAALVDTQLQIACVLTVAESIGAMDRDFNLAVQYAKDRIAFGRPIGSFQAIKHQLADTSLMLEMSKAMAQAAAEAVGAGRPEAAEVASMAKAFIGDCGLDLAQSCFQVFGGIGYTWEHDQHLYLRRLTADAALYGDPAWHRERLCQLGGL